MVHVIEDLPHKHNALRSTPALLKERKREKEEKFPLQRWQNSGKLAMPTLDSSGVCC
jgi:hypothetical protein